MARTKQKARRSGRKRDRDEKRENGESNKQDGDQWQRRGYTLANKNNELFELYYKNLMIVPESEWETFMTQLREPLPATFRVTGFKSMSKELVKLIKSTYLPSLADLTIDGQKIDPPKCLSWYPEEVAWQLNLARGIIRKNDNLAKLHEFLVSETESGNITRQEAVSMIPPLVLDVKPHHKVLDLCAAPGSKTSQLIEMLHADENIRIPEGFVVANDSDNKRCYLMVHQVKRLQSPNFVIINHDASNLPNLWTHDKNERKGFITYDRVLCDVPCSGDGTMRKNADIWTKWTPACGANLHGLQSRILKRGLELLNVGGKLVYSTCSFNPVENEAVLADMLETCKGSVRLVDVSDQMPDLKRSPGMTKWKIMTKKREFFERYEDVPEALRTQIRPSMFPPPESKLEELNLDRCIRILPHQQNTGGFFVALLEKTSQLPWLSKLEKKEEEKDATEKKETQNEDAETGEKRKAADPPEHRRSKKQKFSYKEDPFIWLTGDDKDWLSLKEFYGLSDDFNPELLMIRCADGKKRNIYFTSEAIKEIAIHSKTVKFINMGVKMFARSSSTYIKCDFRPVQEGINTIFPYVKSRTAELAADDLVTLLQETNPLCTLISEASRANIEALDQGGCVFICKNSGQPNTPACDIVLPGWRGYVSCRLFLRKFDRSHFLRMFGKELKDRGKKDGEEDEDEMPVEEKVPTKGDETTESETKAESIDEGEKMQVDDASGKKAEAEPKAEPMTTQSELKEPKDEAEAKLDNDQKDVAEVKAEPLTTKSEANAEPKDETNSKTDKKAEPPAEAEQKPEVKS